MHFHASQNYLNWEAVQPQCFMHVMSFAQYNSTIVNIRLHSRPGATPWRVTLSTRHLCVSLAWPLCANVTSSTKWKAHIAYPKDAREREFICQVDIHNIYINCNNGRLPVKALAHRSWPPRRGQSFVFVSVESSFSRGSWKWFMNRERHRRTEQDSPNFNSPNFQKGWQMSVGGKCLILGTVNSIYFGQVVPEIHSRRDKHAYRQIISSQQYTVPYRGRGGTIIIT